MKYILCLFVLLAALAGPSKAQHTSRWLLQQTTGPVEVRLIFLDFLLLY